MYQSLDERIAITYARIQRLYAELSELRIAQRQGLVTFDEWRNSIRTSVVYQNALFAPASWYGGIDNVPYWRHVATEYKRNFVPGDEPVIMRGSRQNQMRLRSCSCASKATKIYVEQVFWRKVRRDGRTIFTHSEWHEYCKPLLTTIIERLAERGYGMHWNTERTLDYLWHVIGIDGPRSNSLENCYYLWKGVKAFFGYGNEPNYEERRETVLRLLVIDKKLGRLPLPG